MDMYGDIDVDQDVVDEDVDQDVVDEDVDQDVVDEDDVLAATLMGSPAASV